MQVTNYDAFVSYNSVDREVAERIVKRLESDWGLTCWLDTRQLVPGEPWQEAIEAALEKCGAVVVLIGSSGIGPWHNVEWRTANHLSISTNEGRRTIPVILPGVSEETVKSLPSFLRRLTWVDLRKGITRESLRRLHTGILGASAAAAAARIVSEPHSNQRVGRIRSTAEEAIRSIRHWAKEVQNEDGGMPAEGPGSISCAWATAGIASSLWEAGESFGELWMRRMANWLLDNQNDDYGLPQITRGEPSICDASASLALTLVRAEAESPSPRYRKALEGLSEWLLCNQEARAGWSWRRGWGPSWTASTAWALLAVHALVSSPFGSEKDQRVALTRGVNWLLESRNSDCGWGSFAGDKSRVAVTGLVVLTLVQLGFQDEACLSLDYISRMQLPNGSWPSTIERPGSQTIARFGDAYSLDAVARCTGDLQIDSVRKGFRALMRSYHGSYFQYVDSEMRTWPTRDGLRTLCVIARLAGSSVVRDPE
jgi:TIR domain